MSTIYARPEQTTARVIGYTCAAPTSSITQGPLIRAGVAEDDVHCEVDGPWRVSRPVLRTVLRLLQPGDTLVVTRLEHLGESLSALVELAATLHDRRIRLRVLHEDIDTDTGSTALARLLSALSRRDREPRTPTELIAGTPDARGGLLPAEHARRPRSGRPPLLNREQAALAQHLYDQGDHTVTQIAALLSVRRSTLYGYLHRPARAAAGPG